MEGKLETLCNRQVKMARIGLGGSGAVCRASTVILKGEVARKT